MILWGTVLTAPVFTQQNGYVYGQVTFGSNCDPEGWWYVQVTDEMNLFETTPVALNPFNNYVTESFPIYSAHSYTVAIYRLKPSASRLYRHNVFLLGAGNQFNMVISDCN